LRLAQQKGLNAYHIYDEHKEGMAVYGAAQWNDIIMESIKKNFFDIHFQNVIDKQSAIIQKEAMIRLQHDGQLVSAGIFIPMAEYLGITHHIDQWVINTIFKRIVDGSSFVYSINLSQSSLKEANFSSWLKQQLEQLTKQQQQQVIFEVPEYHINKIFFEYKNLLGFLEQYACQFCIDHFGVGFTNMDYLADINIDFIKIHGSYVGNIQETPEVSHYIRQVVTMAHSHDIQVIAEGIEAAEELDILKSLKVDLFQGYHIGRPEPE